MHFGLHRKQSPSSSSVLYGKQPGSFQTVWSLPHWFVRTVSTLAWGPFYLSTPSSPQWGARGSGVQVRLRINWARTQSRKRKILKSYLKSQTEMEVFHLERKQSGWIREMRRKNLLQLAPHRGYLSVKAARTASGPEVTMNVKKVDLTILN
jgi:hypothetical protein